MKKRFYAAYGSNLNIEQMKYRCPTAKLCAAGVIEDYALQFKGSSHSAYATIAPMKGAKVPVAVWELQLMDELSLDRYEGFPTHYFKQNIPVLIEGIPMSAMVYIMNPKMDFGILSQYYYKTVLKGYMDCGLDVDVLNQAVIDSSQKFYANEATDMKLLDNKIEDEGEDIDESDDISLRPM